KAKLLQHYAGKKIAGKKANGGFTLIELLVVIIIIGILSAIALPSFLNQANKAKQSEAKTYIGSMNRAQQAYFMENGTMATDDRFAQLGLGVKEETDSYRYSLVDGTKDTNDNHQYSAATASPIDPALKLYAGGVKVATIGSGTSVEATTLATLCEALLPAAAPNADGGFTGEDASGNYTDSVYTDYLVKVDTVATDEPECGAKMKAL
ncbi:MAG: type IV pilin-like G/H family protein, partial [Phormidesmis sp.]